MSSEGGAVSCCGVAILALRSVGDVHSGLRNGYLLLVSSFGAPCIRRRSSWRTTQSTTYIYLNLAPGTTTALTSVCLNHKTCAAHCTTGERSESDHFRRNGPTAASPQHTNNGATTATSVGCSCYATYVCVQEGSRLDDYDHKFPLVHLTVTKSLISTSNACACLIPKRTQASSSGERRTTRFVGEVFSRTAPAPARFSPQLSRRRTFGSTPP